MPLPERHFIFPLLFGTHQPDVTLAVDISQRQLTEYDLPLLSQEEVDELLDQLADISRQDPCPNKSFVLKGKYQTTHAFRQLVTDAGGWPRGVQAVLEQVCSRIAQGHRVETIMDYAYIAGQVRDRLTKLYQLRHFNNFPVSAVLYALAGIELRSLSETFPGSTITVEQLVYQRSLASLSPALQLQLPFLWLASILPAKRLELESSPVAIEALQRLHELVSNPAAALLSWQAFEVFCRDFLAMRLSALVLAQRNNISDLLHNCTWVGLPPAVKVAVCCLEPGTIERQWPSSYGDTPFQVGLREGPKISLSGESGFGRVLLNGVSAAFADVVLSLEACNSKRPFLVLLQAKWTDPGEQLRSVDIFAEYSKCKGAIEASKQLREAIHGWALVVITSSEVTHVPRDSDVAPGSHLGIVSQAGFPAFFGTTFCARALLSAKLRVNINDAAPSDLVAALRVESPSARALICDLRKHGIRLRDTEDLLSRLPPEEDKERIRKRLETSRVAKRLEFG